MGGNLLFSLSIFMPNMVCPTSGTELGVSARSVGQAGSRSVPILTHNQPRPRAVPIKMICSSDIYRFPKHAPSAGGVTHCGAIFYSWQLRFLPVKIRRKKSTNSCTMETCWVSGVRHGSGIFLFPTRYWGNKLSLIVTQLTIVSVSKSNHASCAHLQGKFISCQLFCFLSICEHFGGRTIISHLTLILFIGKYF